MQDPPQSEFFYTLLALLSVSLGSVVGSATFALGRRLQASIPYLLAAAAGALLGTAVFDLLPEALEHSQSSKQLGVVMAVGLLLSFLLERLLGFSFETPQTDTVVALEAAVGQASGQHRHHELFRFHHQSLLINVLLSGALHSMIDGLGIAVAFSASRAAGVATTIAVLLHEVPHHVADVGILISGGLSKTRALLWNFLATTGCATGGVLVLLFGLRGQWLTSVLLPFAAANFLYISLAMLMPELQRERNRMRSLWQVCALVLALALAGVFGEFIPENQTAKSMAHRVN